MSRMTKFLKQDCVFERAVRNGDGTVVLNAYGDVQYEAPVQLKCRRERFVRDIQTNNGAVLQTSSRYFLDESEPIEADDRLDGHVVISIEEYTNQFGTCEGYEVYV